MAESRDIKPNFIGAYAREFYTGVKTAYAA